MVGLDVVTEWTGNAAPKVELGKWNPDKANSYNCGTVIFDCQPFNLVMCGANSAEMDSRIRWAKKRLDPPRRVIQNAATKITARV